MDAPREPLRVLAGLPPRAQLAEALRRLSGDRGGALGRFEVASELTPDPGRIDGRLLEEICELALATSPGAVFTGAPEAHILAAFALAHAADRRGGPAPAEAVSMLLGLTPAGSSLSRALEGLRVLDPACGGGALLATAARLALSCGARLRLFGIEIAPLAAEACRGRLALLGFAAEITAADALGEPWPEIDLLIANPPFVRHEALEPAAKARASRRSGLSRQADLSAHFAAVALSAAPVAAMVWPRALFTARSAAPLLAQARARGGFVLSLRSRAAGSFAASVDTLLGVWREGAPARAELEATVPLAQLSDPELCGIARGVLSPRLTQHEPAPPARGRADTLGDVCRVRFGVKSGCNAFFHLLPLEGNRFAGALAGEVSLRPEDVVPLLASLKEARAPEALAPARVLFRPGRLGAAARAYVRRGEELGVHLRPTCAGRSPWWRLAPGRPPAPVLYPAKIGARAFAVLNFAGLYEDKKWHALFPDRVEPWLVAALLSSTPVRLAIDLAARQLTGAQAIADVDCRILAATPFPGRTALAGLGRELARPWQALVCDRVTTELETMLDRPAQRELDQIAGRALGLTPGEVRSARNRIVDRVSARLEQAARIREAIG